VLRESPSVSTMATTWNTGSAGFVGSQRLLDYVRQSVKDHIDRFLNAYLAANPK